MIKHVLIVFGTRPEAIKMAPLVKEFLKDTDHWRVSVCITGQHREMLDQVLDLFDIKPDYDLNIMQKQQDLYDVTARILTAMRTVLLDTHPDLVLVHGDTVTAMAVSLAAFYQKIAVGHVEAGLRTFNRYSPWPEEMNRQLISRLATFHFAPTALACENLVVEGIRRDTIYITGNTVIDALQMTISKLNTDTTLTHKQALHIRETGYDTNRLTRGRRLVLITGHRRENFGDGFLQICQAIKMLAEKYPQIDFVYPVHLNPNVQTPVQSILRLTKNGNVFLISPLSYTPFVFLMQSAFLLLTDSGGIQEEAPGLGKPVLVMRDTTERPEAITAGTAKLVGANQTSIVLHVSKLLDDPLEYQKMASAQNPYGDGNASRKILDYLTDKCCHPIEIN